MSLRVVGTRLALFVFLGSVGAGCGGTRPPDSPEPTERTTTVASALVDPSDRTHAGRAAYYGARAAAIRDLGAKQRQLASVLAAKPSRPTPGTGTDWSVTEKTQLEARATALDATATEIQSFADFHAAEAAKEVTR